MKQWHNDDKSDKTRITQRQKYDDNKKDDKTMTMWMTLADLSPDVSRLLQASPHLQPNKLVASQGVQHTEHDGAK